MELFKASRQWSQRPADERFSSLEAMDEACYAYFGSVAKIASDLIQASM
jgi:hypothetical protein